MGGFDPFELVGWLASLFTLLAYAMRTMLPLRIFGILANLSFITFAAVFSLYSILALHLILLPFNLWRLWEILRLTRAIRAARDSDLDLSWLRPYLRARRYRDGEFIFRKGDKPDNLYYLASGRIVLPEAGIKVDAGEIFGEIAFLTDARERTLSARCMGECEIYAMDEASFMRLYFQRPEFGFYIVRLVSRRLIGGTAIEPAAYRPVQNAQV